MNFLANDRDATVLAKYSHSEPQLNAMLSRRAAGEPVAKIIEEKEFWSLPFKTTTATLDPRPDSETLIDAALECLPDKDASLRILDLGTGTGCLIMAALSEYPNARGIAVDKSPDALNITRYNAEQLGFTDRLELTEGSWSDVTIEGSFDLILSNPPYIPAAVIPTLQVEVAEFEPRVALDGGDDGLECYRELSNIIPPLLKKDEGLCLLEIGQGQEAEIQDIMEQGGLRFHKHWKDLPGIIRCLGFRR